MNVTRYTKQFLVVVAFALTANAAIAGNPDRAGSAGVGQLLINPWARSAGLANATMASITGIESVFLNVAGLAFLDKTELVFTNTNYLVGTDIQINSVGFCSENGRIKCYCLERNCHVFW